MAGEELGRRIKQEARRLGFDLCRIVPVQRAPHADFFELWLDAGRAGEMAYLERNREKRRNPALLADSGVDAFRSMLVLGVNHYQFDLPAALRDDPSRGIVASYAWGDDYHEIIRPALYELDAFIRSRTGCREQGKCLVDTGPVLERDWAQIAGIGFTGKNCCTIHPRDGSWLLLATILTAAELPFDERSPAVSKGRASVDLSSDQVLAGLPWQDPSPTWDVPISDVGRAVGTCGRCTRCLTACPTDAFIGPYHLDPQRCISYWTIESRQPIPRELRPHFGNRIFGCDICQEVCPWNQRLEERTPLMDGLAAQADRIALPLLEGFAPETPYWLDQAAFSARFRRSPIKRAKRAGMLRNVCVALGNWADPSAVDALVLALQDVEPLVRGHAAWALGRVPESRNDERAFSALAKALEMEGDSEVRSEIYAALHGEMPAETHEPS